MADIAIEPVRIHATARLTLRELADADAPFVIALLNDPDFLRHIGDKGVRTLADAHGYLRTGPLASYARHGFGLWRVGEGADEAPVGMCGLLRRDWLDAPDVGYAFLPAARGRGLAYEAVAATLDLARTRFGLARVLAIVDPANVASVRLLEKAGFVFERDVTAPGETTQLGLYAWHG
jgi:RimJ/RimL family protein N-acetyltransferase